MVLTVCVVLGGVCSFGVLFLFLKLSVVFKVLVCDFYCLLILS